MRTSGNVVIEPDVTIPLPEGVTWAELVTLIKEEKNQQLLDKIDPETFRFILDDSNYSKVYISILQTLKKIDPASISKNHIDKLIKTMRLIALRHQNHE